MSKNHGRTRTHCVRLHENFSGQTDDLVNVQDAINAAAELAGLIVAAAAALPDDHRRKSIETGAEILREALDAIGDRVAAIDMMTRRA